LTNAEHRVDLIVGQRPVGRRYRAQHVGEQLDLIERDGIMDAIVEVVSHRSTSVAIAEVLARGRPPASRLVSHAVPVPGSGPGSARSRC
jgi:hypothetical protein